MMRALLWVSLACAAEAAAAPNRRVIVVEPPTSLDVPASISNVLFLQRCTGGCEITKGTSTDARTNVSTIPTSSSTISEFVGAAGVPGALADDEWNAVVTCVREVYSPYQVTVTDQRPADGSYHMAVLAGNPSEVGLGNDILGIAPLAGNCSPIDNAISFSFANHHSLVDEQRVFNLCWTVAQESAHAFGLDHTYAFSDGSSTCNDPMTYRVDCGGQRFFRNFSASCGENTARACRCTATQNSHQKLLDVFGAATPITAPPTASVSVPANNVALGAIVGAAAGSKRGVATVDVFLNGSKWATAKGAMYGKNGQPANAIYTIPIPADVPTSKLDVFVRACDDIGGCTDSAVVSSYKGSPAGCTSSDGCLAEQSCDDGFCSWPAASGEIGDECGYRQFCKSDLCTGTDDLKICTRACTVNNDDCPDGLACIATGDSAGVCFVEDSGGCCSVGHTSGNGPRPWIYGGFSVLLIAVITRRRRHPETA